MKTYEHHQCWDVDHVEYAGTEFYAALHAVQARVRSSFSMSSTVEKALLLG